MVGIGKYEDELKVRADCRYRGTRFMRHWLAASCGLWWFWGSSRVSITQVISLAASEFEAVPSCRPLGAGAKRAQAAQNCS